MSDEMQFIERPPDDIPTIVYESPFEGISAFMEITKNGILRPENFQLEKQSILHQSIMVFLESEESKFAGKVETSQNPNILHYQYNLDIIKLEDKIEDFTNLSGIWSLNLNRNDLSPHSIGITVTGWKESSWSFLLPFPFETFRHTFEPKIDKSEGQSSIQVNGVVYLVKTDIVIRP